MEKLKGEWPEYMIIPSPRDFCRGDWAKSTDGSLELDICCGGLRDHPEVREECGAKFCLVGFAAVAFNEKGCEPEYIENPATGQFLEKLMELGGDKSPRSNGLKYTCYDASNFFEESGITSEEAHELWIKTSRHFGYDV